MEAPGRTFPKALAGAVVLVVAMYVLPLAACLGVMPDALDWQLGFFATVAGKVGGPWLSWALVAAAAVSQVRLCRRCQGDMGILGAGCRRRCQPGEPLLRSVYEKHRLVCGWRVRWAAPGRPGCGWAPAAVSQIGFAPQV